MSTKRTDISNFTVDPQWKIGIVVSRYHQREADAMVQSAKELLGKAGIQQDHILIVEAPGSFELPLMARALITEKGVNGIVAIGILLEGETSHAAVVAQAVATGLMNLQLEYGIPCAQEVLHVLSLEQASDRVEAGAEGARAVLQALEELRKLNK